MNYNFILDKLAENKYLKEYLNPESLPQLKKYLISGISSFLVEYAIFYLFLNAFGFQKYLSNGAGMFTGFWLSFLLNRYWSFKSKENFIKQLSLYGALFFINLAISTLLMYVFSNILGIVAELSKILIMGMIVLWNFVIFKKIIYRN